MEQLFLVAVEEQVAEGRPRALVESKEQLNLVVEHFVGQV